MTERNHSLQAWDFIHCSIVRMFFYGRDFPMVFCLWCTYMLHLLDTVYIHVRCSWSFQTQKKLWKSNATTSQYRNIAPWWTKNRNCPLCECFKIGTIPVVTTIIFSCFFVISRNYVLNLNLQDCNMNFYTYLDTYVRCFVSYIFRTFAWPYWISMVYLGHAMYLLHHR